MSDLSVIYFLIKDDSKAKFIYMGLATDVSDVSGMVRIMKRSYLEPIALLHLEPGNEVRLKRFREKFEECNLLGGWYCYKDSLKKYLERNNNARRI